MSATRGLDPQGSPQVPVGVFPAGGCVRARGMPAILLLVLLLAPLVAGCASGGARSDGIPSVDAPFTLTALDVGQATFLFHC